MPAATPSCRTRTHAGTAQPVLNRSSPAGARVPLLRASVLRLRDWDQKRGYLPVRFRCARRPALGMDHDRIAAALSFTDSVENSVDGTATA